MELRELTDSLQEAITSTFRALKTKEVKIMIDMLLLPKRRTQEYYNGKVHIAKLNGRLCGTKRPHSVSEQPNFYQSLQSNPYNDSSHPSGGE